MSNPTPGRRPSWVDDELFPFRSRFIEVDGNTIHYIDEGEGPVLLLYHGNPTWSFLYRHLIQGLRDRFRCVAFDYPGMGLSTARPGFGYRAGELADVAEHFIEQSDLRDLTVMVQDWGGPIGLAAAVRHPTRYRGLIIGNTWAWPARGARSRLVHGLFSTLWGGPIGRLAIERANAFTRLILPAGHRRTTLTSAEMAQYLGPYPDPDSRRPCHTLPREITQARTFLTQLESELDVLAALPALILWADRDFAFKSPDLTRWQNLLPRQHTHILHGAGHFLQDDAAEEVCDVIRAWKPV